MLKFKNAPLEDSLDFVPISTKSLNSTPLTTYSDTRPCSSDKIDQFVSLCRSITDKESANELKLFILDTSIWDLLCVPEDENSFHLVKSNIVHFYFSIPDRVAAVCKLETDEFFFQNSFINHTEASLTNVGERINSERLFRFMPALERIRAFGVPRLAKFPLFWDSLNTRLFTSLPSRSQSLLLTALLQNVLTSHASHLKLLSKILSKIQTNLGFSQSMLAHVILDHFISQGSVDYMDLSNLLCACDHEIIPLLLDGLLVRIWSKDSWILRESFNSQLHYSSCLMCLLSLTSPDTFCSEAEDALMNGVQSRLEHSDPQIRLIGTCVAETLNSLRPLGNDSVLDFALDPNNEIVKHLRDCFRMSGKVLSGNNATPRKFPESPVKTDVPDFTVKPQNYPSSDEDLDDLQPISTLLNAEKDALPPKNAKVKLPRFLADSLKLLRANEDAEMVQLVLARIAQTFTESSKLTRQLHATSAFQALLSLANHFDIANFDRFRIDSLQEILIDQIESVGPEAVNGLFASNKFVLEQKMDILVLISTSAHRLCSPTPINHIKHKQSSSALECFEEAFRAAEGATPTKSTAKKNSFVESICIPLATQAIRHFSHFRGNHVSFLEKFMWLQGILLNFFQNSLKYDRFVEKYLDLVHLTLIASEANASLICQAPIQKALLVGLSVALEAWPESLAIQQYFPRLQEIYQFVDLIAVSPSFAQDPQLQALTASVACSLQELTDPQRLLQEQQEYQQLDFNITRIQNLNI
jgi:hypothetical protein